MNGIMLCNLTVSTSDGLELVLLVARTAQAYRPLEGCSLECINKLDLKYYQTL